MKVTRQHKDTERRLIITLARHERHLTKTEVLAKIKHQKNNIVIAQEFGANVYHDQARGQSKYLYTIPAYDFHNKRDQFRPDQVQELAHFILELPRGSGKENAIRELLDTTHTGVYPFDKSKFEDAILREPQYSRMTRAYRTNVDDIKPGEDGFYSPRID